MKKIIEQLGSLSAAELGGVAYEVIIMLGQHGRDAGGPLAVAVEASEDGRVDFAEGAAWVAEAEEQI